MADPIEQFHIVELFRVAKIGAHEIHFTNSSFYMVLTVGLVAALMLGTTAGRRLVPTRMQSVAELTYEFVGTTLRDVTGEEGMKFFPLVFSLFTFILVSNVVGLIPYTFTVASHIVVTAALALLVFFTVIVYGFWKNGLHFLKDVDADFAREQYASASGHFIRSAFGFAAVREFPEGAGGATASRR